VDGRNCWQWVFETPQASYHLIVPTRGSRAIEQVLAEAELEVWVSDCFSAQLKAPAKESKAACDALLGGPVITRNGQRLRKRYVKHRDHLFTFLRREDVPPDNNICERVLRKSVVHRKVSGGFRSRWGAEAFATLTSVLQTAHKHGKGPLTALTSLLGPCLDLHALTQPP